MRHSSFRIRSSVLASLIAVAVGGSVLAGVGPFAISARADDPQRAKELYQEGTRYFDLGQFDKAIDAFQSGYREKPDPIFLYNIAQAYRLSGDANKALFFYKGYLRNSPKAHNRADVEQKIQALQKQVGEGQGQAPRPTSPPTPTSTPGTDAMRPPAPPPVGAASARDAASSDGRGPAAGASGARARCRLGGARSRRHAPASDAMGGDDRRHHGAAAARARRGAPRSTSGWAWASTAGRRACRARPTPRWRCCCPAGTRSGTTRPRSFIFGWAGRSATRS